MLQFRNSRDVFVIAATALVLLGSSIPAVATAASASAAPADGSAPIELEAPVSSSAVEPVEDLDEPTPTDLSAIDLPAPVESQLVSAPASPTVRSVPSRQAQAQASGSGEDAPIVSEEITSTSRRVERADGTGTLEVYTEPRFVEEEPGEWEEIDLSLVPTTDGGATVTTAEDPARFGRHADDAAMVLPTSAGDLVISYPGARPSVEGEADGDRRSFHYEGAIAGGRDLVLTPTADGAKEEVIIDDPAQSGSYRSRIELPDGVTARQVEAGVELVDGGDAVIARISDGRAYDASDAFPGAVHVRLVTQDEDRAILETAVDSQWLSSPERVFPVTIDPGLESTTQTEYLGPGERSDGAIDTYVDTYQCTATHAGAAELWLGGLNVAATCGPAGAARSRILARLPTDALGEASGDQIVTSASLSMWVFGGWTPSVHRTFNLYELTGVLDGNTSWNTQPTSAVNPSATQTVGSSPTTLTFSGSGMVTLAQKWLDGTASNHGVVIRAATETDLNSWRRIWGGPRPAGSERMTLRVDYLVAPPTVTATAGPASASVTWSTTQSHGATVTGWKMQAHDETTGADLGVSTCTTSVSACPALPVYGLTPGHEYTFKVWAVSGTYEGPKRTSNKIVPTAPIAVVDSVGTVAGGSVQCGTPPSSSTHTAPAEIGYCVDVRNLTPTARAVAPIVATLPVGSVPVAGSVSFNGAACTATTSPACVTTGNTVRVTSVTLPIGATRTLAYRARVTVSSGCDPLLNDVKATDALTALVYQATVSVIGCADRGLSGLGLEPWWTFVSRPVGPGATASVNVGNGNLVVQQDDIPAVQAAGDLAFNLRRTYNSLDTDLADLNSLLGFDLGEGWNLNLSDLVSVGGLAGVGLVSAAGQAALPAINPAAVDMVDRDGTRHQFTLEAVDAQLGPLVVSTSGLSGLSTLLTNLLGNPLGTLGALDLSELLDEVSAINPSVVSGYGSNLALCVDARYSPPDGVHMAMWRYVLVDLGTAPPPPNSACGTLVASPPGGRALALGYVTVRPDRVSQTFGFDGRLLSVTDAAGNRLAYSYNPDGRLWKVTEPGVAGCAQPASLAVGCRALHFTYPDASHMAVTDPAGRTVTYTKEQLGATRVLTSVIATNADGDLLEQWAYDYDGRNGVECSAVAGTLCAIRTPRQLADPVDLDATEPIRFTYGTDNRLTDLAEAGATGETPPTTSFTYGGTPDDGTADVVRGNQATLHRGIDRLLRVHQTTEATADSSVALTTTNYTWDSEGCSPETGADIPNNLCAIEQVDLGDPSGGSRMISYVYNPEGNVVQSIVHGDPTTGGDAVTTYAYRTVGYAPSGLPMAPADDTIGAGGAFTVAHRDASLFRVTDLTASVTPRGNAAGAAWTSYRTTYTTDRTPNVAVGTVGPGTNCGQGNSGLLCTQAGPEGVTTTHTYNGRGQELTIQTAPNGPVSYEYATGDRARDGWLHRVVDATGRAATFDYDTAGNVIRTWDRNADARAAGTPTDPDDATVTTYDSGRGGTGPWRWVDSETAPLTAQDTAGQGARTEWVRDAHGNPTRTRPPRGTASGTDDYDLQARYDGRDRSIESSDPAGTTRDAYDANGNPTRHTDGNGHPVGYRYDDAGRLIETVVSRSDSGPAPDGCRTATAVDQTLLDVDADTVVCASTATYDEFGGTSSERDATQDLLLVRGFDRFGRVASEVWPTTDGRTAQVGYGYDLDGNPTAQCTLGATVVTVAACGTYTVATTALPAFVTATEYDHAGRPVTSRYDRIGVNELSAPIGDRETVVTRTTYDTANQETAITDPNLGVTTFGYDGLGRRTLQSVPRDATTRFETRWNYDASGNTVAVIADTDASTLGAIPFDPPESALERPVIVTAYAYDETNRTTAVVEAAQSTDPADVAGLESVTPSTVDPAARNVRTAYVYDPDGNVIGSHGPRAFASGLSPDPAWTTWVDYDTAGQVAATWQPQAATAGADTCASAGPTHRPAAPPGAPGPAYPDGMALCATTVAHDPAGNLTGIVTAGGKSITRTYTNDGLVATSTMPAPDGDGTVTASTTYDADGRPASTSQPGADGGTWVETTTYSADGLPVEVRGSGTGGDLRVRTTTYTLAGQPFVATDHGSTAAASASGPDRVTRLHYFSDGLTRESISDPGGLDLTTRFGYDANGNPTTVFQPAAVAGTAPNPTGLAVTREFTADNLLAEVREPADDDPTRLRRTRYTYDPSGQKLSELVEETDGSLGNVEAGPHAGYQYQATGWLARELDLATTGPEIDYRHNLDGSLASATDATAASPVDIVLDWRLDGLPVSETTTIGDDPFATVTTGYRADGERNQLITTTGGGTSVETWTYATSGSVPTAGHLEFPDASTVDTAWTWTDTGQIATATTGAVTEERTYRPDGSPASITAAGATQTYTSDGLGRIADHGIDGIAGAPDRTYGYDAAGRVLDDDADSGTPGFGYDANSNRTDYRTTTYTYRPDNSLESASNGSQSATIEYDAAGRRVHPDPTDTSCQYQYDFLNRTIGIGGANCDERATYLHDPLSRQIVELTGSSVDPSDLADDFADGSFGLGDGTEEHVAFDTLGDTVLGVESTTTGTGARYDVTSYAADGRVLHHTSSGGSAHGTQLLLTDGQDDVSLITDLDGNQVCARFYEPFATTHSASTCDDADTTNQLWFRSGREDARTGTYRFGSRHYDPATATWTTPDTARPAAPVTDLSIGTDPLTANRYSYVNGDPINVDDPSGHCIEDACVIEAVGAIAAVVATVEVIVTGKPYEEAFEDTFETILGGLGWNVRQVAVALDWVVTGPLDWAEDGLWELGSDVLGGAVDLVGGLFGGGDSDSSSAIVLVPIPPRPTPPKPRHPDSDPVGPKPTPTPPKVPPTPGAVPAPALPPLSGSQVIPPEVLILTAAGNGQDGAGSGGHGTGSDGGSNGSSNTRGESGTTRQSSPIWRALKSWRGGTRTNGASGSARQYYEWDYTHNDIEVYDRRGNHLGSMDPMTGEMTKPPVPGRSIDV